MIINRRDLLKAVLGLAAVPVLPKLQMPIPLTETLDSRFRFVTLPLYVPQRDYLFVDLRQWN